jgi:rare lipoprotein A
MDSKMRISLAALLAALISTPAMAQSEATTKEDDKKRPKRLKVIKNPELDRSGKTQHGEASYYGKEFFGRKMADGTPMDPESNIAASRTLPIGTKAKVTNLENGKSAVVEIRDRGPYIDGRIVDLTPKTAEQLDMKHEGVAPVAVTPIELPGSTTAQSSGN